MKPNVLKSRWIVTLFLLSGCIAGVTFADQMELINGDRYTGKVVSVTDTQVKFQSDVQGQIVLPRDKVSSITFNKKDAAKDVAASRATIPSGSVTNVLEQVRIQGIDPGLLEKVRSQYLGEGGPEANELFNQTVSGIMSGKISIGAIRSQAKSVLAELNDLQKDFDDPELNDLLRQYGSLLQNFVNQADVDNIRTQTNSAARIPVPKAR